MASQSLHTPVSFFINGIVLELKNTFFTIKKGEEDIHLLDDICLKVPSRHFMAIVGPSGCGKSTLLKLIAGINVESQGNVYWNGRDLSEEEDLEPSEIGYVPQFSIAYDELTVEESIESAVRLRVKTKNSDTFYAIVDRALESTGLMAIKDRPVKVLSGGQKRRLALAMELVTDPVLLLCDEVTSGLDPRSEQEIVKLMHDMSRNQNRIVINVTHSLAGLDLYDSVLVLHEGKVVYHGPPRALEHYFSVDEAENVYPTLTKRTSSDWQASWMKRQEQYYENSGMNAQPDPNLASQAAQTPGHVAQFFALLGRRFKIMFRDSGQLLLQIAILIGFPALVILFDLDGVDQTKSLSDALPSTLEQMKQERDVATFNLNLGGLVSGLVMFQVILLTLMGSNNSAREIAGERKIFEKEKLGGVRPGVYLASKVVYLSLLVFVQSFWMWLFVQTICDIPSTSPHHLLLLVLVNAAMTAICLGISGLAKSADQASLLSIYLVGFQLPLSGAVLALPSIAAWATRPFISAYWTWAGIMDSLDPKHLRYVKEVTETWLSPVSICYLVLIVHIAAGLLLAYIGAKRAQWRE
ncbi:MAG: ATP-binding cassette domain-containing protein [Verrucomicrobiales bacterium]|nr:ATP-binding cassette domain-containing protein [Verrucomicrobiales bacterium]